jgi:hypothetical protein
MHHYPQATIVANDLNSMAQRIEALPAHEDYTKALNLVQEAEAAVRRAQQAVHEREMRQRYDV